MIAFMYSRTRVSIKNENQSLNCILTSCLSTHKTCISTEERCSVTRSSSLETRAIWCISKQVKKNCF